MPVTFRFATKILAADRVMFRVLNSDPVTVILCGD